MYDNINYIMNKGNPNYSTYLTNTSLNNTKLNIDKPTLQFNYNNKFPNTTRNSNKPALHNFEYSYEENSNLKNVNNDLNNLNSSRIHYEDYLKSSMDMFDLQLNVDILKYKIKRINNLTGKIIKNETSISSNLCSQTNRCFNRNELNSIDSNTEKENFKKYYNTERKFENKVEKENSNYNSVDNNRIKRKLKNIKEISIEFPIVTEIKDDSTSKLDKIQPKHIKNDSTLSK